MSEDKAQRNFTDPESKIMNTGRRAFHQRYNGQAVVDEAPRVVVAADRSQGSLTAGAPKQKKGHPV